MKLSQKQQQVLDFITKFLKTNGRYPTYKEIQTHFEFSSKGTVFGFIQKLRSMGFLEESKGCIKITQQTHNYSLECSLIGQLIGDLPIETFKISSQINIASLLNTNNKYALLVNTNHFNEEFICSGDIIIIHPTTLFLDGETVLASYNLSTIIKKAFHIPPYIRLESFNQFVQPIIVNASSICIHGTIQNIIRKF